VEAKVSVEERQRAPARMHAAECAAVNQDGPRLPPIAMVQLGPHIETTVVGGPEVPILGGRSRRRRRSRTVGYNVHIMDHMVIITNFANAFGNAVCPHVAEAVLGMMMGAAKLPFQRLRRDENGEAAGLKHMSLL